MASTISNMKFLEQKEPGAGETLEKVLCGQSTGSQGGERGQGQRE